MSGELIFGNARVVAGGEVLRGTVCVRNGRIAAVDGGRSAAASLDLDGDYLIPGLVELHTDNFERHMMPRPKVRWPELPALFGHDAEIAAAGITTVFDALGVGDSDPDAMRGQDMAPVLAAIDHATADDLLRAEHRLHIRLELPAPNTRALFAPFAGHPLVGLISLMDHTPGQRQWENIEQARIYYCGKKGWSDEKFKRSVADSRDLQEANAVPNRRFFADYARAGGIPLASHDDTRLEHVEQAHGEGAAISEFPTRVEAARAAREKGMAIVMGAPNVVRGGSHSGNIAAAELARRGLLDSLSSDYVPSSLLLAAFRLVPDAGFTIAQAVATVSLNPARSVGLQDRGEIAPGLRADLVQVRMVGQQPVVRAVWREGIRVV
jgi:alpha-D-ribose 1-methylphosphonate 5-triphosphate diphosphatase